MEELGGKSGAEDSGLALQQEERITALPILSESIIKLAFFRARHQQVQPRFDLRFLRDRACEVYRPPFRPTTRQELDLWDWKLAWDLSLLEKVLVICRDEVSQGGGFSTLEQYVARRRELMLEDKTFRVLAKQPSNRRGQGAYEKEREEEKKVEELKKEERRLEDLHEETLYRSISIKQYFQRYHNSRVEQNKYKVKLAEKVLKQRILNVAEDEENTAHHLTMGFLRTALERLDEKLGYWTAERKSDVAWRNLEIKKVDEEHKNITKRMKELLVSYGEREKEIEECEREREERRKVEKMEEERVMAAVRIQAWWRGCMVRCGLGPFCPDHLRKKKKKCKKK